jgi:hypothetical protein
MRFRRRLSSRAKLDLFHLEKYRWLGTSFLSHLFSCFHFSAFLARIIFSPVVGILSFYIAFIIA